MAKQKSPQFGFFIDRGELVGNQSFTCFVKPIEDVATALAEKERLVIDRNMYGKPAPHLEMLAFQPSKHPCTVIALGNTSEHLVELSAKLGTIIACYEYYDTSGYERFLVYADGLCIESYDIVEEDFAESTDPSSGQRAKPFDHVVIHDYSAYRFRSDRRKVDASLVKKPAKLLNDAAKFYGLLFPDLDDMPDWSESIGGPDPATFERVDVLRAPQLDELPEIDVELRQAIDAFDVSQVKAALKKKPRVDVIAGTTFTPIQYALQNAEKSPDTAVEIVRLLAQAGADLNATNNLKEGPPLFKFISPLSSGGPWALPVIEVLLDLGANVNLQNPYFSGMTALHLAASRADLMLVQLLHSRGANPKIVDQKGETARQLAQKAAKQHEKGSNSAERLLPELRAVMSYLEAAENGAAPSGYSREAAAEAAAEIARQEEREREELKAKLANPAEYFKDFLGAMKTIKSLMMDEEEIKADATRQALESVPKEYHVTKLKALDSQYKSAREGDILTLKSANFAEVGNFAIEEYPGVQLCVLIDTERGAYALIGNASGGQYWVDLVRYHADETAITITNANIPKVAQVELPKHPKIRKPKATVSELLKLLDETPAPIWGLEPITGEQFPDRLAIYLTEESAFRRSQLV